MKKLGKILYYVLAGGVALFAVGYLVYEIVWKDILDMTNIIRTLLIVATMILAIWRVATGNGRGKKKHSEQFFRENYGAMIGNAFIIPGKAKKSFFATLEYYQWGQPAKLVDGMRGLESACTNNDERFAVSFFKALGYAEMRSHAKAAESYEKALLYKENSTAASNLALCYQRLGDFEKAEESLRFAIKIEPNNAHAYHNMAQLLFQKDAYDDALAYADMALEKQNNLYQAYSVKALIFAERGDMEAYREALRKYALYGGDADALVATARRMGSKV